jgi:hypothetical protein
MDILLILLRLIHILAGVAWVGLAAALAFFIAPAALNAGGSGMHFLRSLFGGTTIARVFPMVSGITMLAGILMYVLSNSGSHFSQTGNIVLGLGALFGIIAGIHGGAVTGRATKTLAEALMQPALADNQAIPADTLAGLRAQGEKLVYHARVSFALSALALLGMAAARYL